MSGGLRHDPQKRRQAQRHGRERGVRIFIAASELRAAGIDPEASPPAYRVFPGAKRDGGLQLRLYRS